MSESRGYDIYVYGDSAYPITPHTLGPHKGAVLAEEQEAFNSQMSGLRVVVEWAFGDIVSYFAFLNYKKNLKVLL